MESTPPLPLKQRALQLFRSNQISSGSKLLLDSLATSPPEAVAAIIEIVDANRSAPQVRNLLASALDASPTNAQLQSCAGRLAVADGDFEQANVFFAHAHHLSPLNPAYALELGACLKHQNRLQSALPFLRDAHQRAPSQTSTRILADAEFEADHPELALPLLSQLLKATPKDVPLRLRLAETHNQLGDNSKAGELISAGLELTPDDPSLFMALAQALEDDGDNAAAEQAYLSALSSRPAWALALAGLLNLKRGNASTDLLDTAQTLIENATTPHNERALLGYALGKALDAMGRYPAALQAWQTANKSREVSAGSFDPSWLDHHIRMLETAPLTSIASNDVKEEMQMIFVVGMPRSGTTLTETILSAHPSVHGCGELPDFPRLALELGPSWPTLVNKIPAQQLSSMRSNYLRSASRHAQAGKTVLVDKAPLNFFQLSLIQAIFPAARVIWCRRDPRDVALSIYSENFSPASSFSTSMAGIAAYQEAEEHLLHLWQRTLSLPIYVQDYAALATDPRNGAEKLIEFSGLKWDPAVLKAHETAGTVQTPSRWQVREPIHTRSIGRWKNYPALFSKDPEPPDC